MTRILYPATANFGRGKRGKDRSPRKRRLLGMRNLIAEGATTGYKIGKSGLRKVVNAVDGAITGAALGISAKTGAYGLKGTGRLWRKKLMNR